MRISADIKAREKALAPFYMQVAHEFADLHDRAGRMKAKGCISEVLEWRSASPWRSFVLDQTLVRLFIHFNEIFIFWQHLLLEPQKSYMRWISDAYI